MAKTRPVIPVGWFLREWMDELRVNQALMMKDAGWSKTTASLLYNRQQDYNPDLVAAAANALRIAPFELFLLPEEAFHIRRLRAAVDDEYKLRAVADKRSTFKPAPPETGRRRNSSNGQT